MHLAPLILAGLLALSDDGRQAFEAGSLEDAVRHWQAALAQARTARDVPGEIDTAINLAAAYESLGHNKLAVELLEPTITLAQKLGDKSQYARAAGSLGVAYAATRRGDLAEQIYQNALASADDQAAAVILNNWGTLRLAQGRNSEAQELFQRSIERARDPLLAAKAQSNAALAAGNNAQAETLAAAALKQLQDLKPSHEQAYLLLTCGEVFQRLGQAERAGHAFQQASQIAETLHDKLAGSYAFGALGGLAERAARYDEALKHTRQAAFLAQQSPETLYRWEWQTGRILRAQRQTGPAIAAYKRAVDTLQLVRIDLSLGRCSTCSGLSFREFAGPVYFELADLLLRRADELPDPQPTLREARETVELLKSFELEDYFQDDCVNLLRAKNPVGEKIAKDTAVIYIIPLPDRTEILVELSSGLQRFKAPVTAEQLTAEIRQFRKNLEKRTTHEYLTQGQRIYDWLLRPIVPDLHGIQTLVFVPDGALRTIPLAALHDGERFLVDKFAISVTPGLTMTDQRAPRGRRAQQLLLAGLSHGVQGFAPLDYVPVEVGNIQGMYKADKLLNTQFLSATLDREFAENQYSIVHIASHGQFERNVGNTFILTYDGNLSLNSLERLIRPSQFRGQPVELLTLSACETAAGDDRAALGLAGVAVKAGAQSALATLWYVNDQASTTLVSEFYAQWKHATKAQALQRAQLKMLADRRYRHPCYWAPYLLIGDWS